ncbi:hypothetical protein STRIC_0635 [Streptococcus ictaluri 707-05]|uniref:Uncharacterized protein n=1 Tax=Streptococcus ictaluri 707-05 TaxID=764299 RepID=G5JZC5_9STRE|nr:hypothetical protein STRIC_0635 [Streptococcus ictaluri 707-05]
MLSSKKANQEKFYYYYLKIIVSKNSLFGSPKPLLLTKKSESRAF